MGVFVWFIAAPVVAAVGWFVYDFNATGVVGCENGNFFGGEYKGGVASSGSLVTAKILAVSLWLAGGLLACFFQRKLLLLFAGFVVLYVVGLLVLDDASSQIWGPRICV